MKIWLYDLPSFVPLCYKEKRKLSSEGENWDFRHMLQSQGARTNSVGFVQPCIHPKCSSSYSLPHLHACSHSHTAILVFNALF